MNKTIEIPPPTIKPRPIVSMVEQTSTEHGLHPLLARIIAGRTKLAAVDLATLLSPKLTNLEHPSKMADMQKAASRVAQAIINREYIGIETDYDCDGQTSHAVLYYNLYQHFQLPEAKIYSYIGNRLTDGYGLSNALVTKILQTEPRPSLIITADNGSSDAPRINKLAAQGIDVIITDHHEMPVAGVPKSAYACLNPNRNDCGFVDKNIAGCMVAWLLMTATRQELINLGYLPADAAKLADSLDFVAVGTVADCVSINSNNNRAVIAYGLKLIDQASRPCWRAIKPLITNQITAEDLSFRIAPLLNSDGRLATAFGSVSFLLAKTDPEAYQWIEILQQQNQQRKQIQRDITSKGLKQAYDQVTRGRFTLTIFLEDGHIGVHGISASRIKEYFGRPTVFLAPKLADNSDSQQLISGSIRGVEQFHVRQALQFIADQAPELLIAFGGHSGAGGVTLLRADLAKFSELFEQAARQQLTQTDLGPVIWTDGEIPGSWINLEMLTTISKLEPFGREFEAPIFEVQAKLLSFRLIGDATHARVVLAIDGKPFQGVWFNFRHSHEDEITVNIGDQVLVAYTLKLNVFNNCKTCELQIVAMKRV